MHYFQQRYLRENYAFAPPSGLLTIDLPNKGLLSGIEMRVWGKNGDDADKPNVWLHDRLKKIQVIVNGSQVVKQLDGRQLLAMMLYKRTPHFSHDMKNMNAASAEEVFYINLGRHYHDLEYMLDLGQVNDPEIRIEYAFDRVLAEGWADGVAMLEDPKPQISVIAHLLRDPDVVPKGYIKTSEIHRVDNAASLGYNMTVSRGPTYSNLYLQSWYKNMGLGAILEHMEVNINSDDLIPIRVGPIELATEITRMYGLHSMAQQTRLLGGTAYPFPLEQSIFQPDLGGLQASVPLGLDVWGNYGKPGWKDIATGLVVDNTSHNCRFKLKGIWPFSVSAIPLFDPWDPYTWIDSSALGDFWVRIEETTGAKTGVMKLLADEVVTKYVTPSWP